jgi:hypothetical protein
MSTTLNSSRSQPTSGWRHERGMALITTLLVLTLVSGLIAGMLAAVMADQRNSGLDRDHTQAYAAAHAGLEKLTSDLNGLFQRNFSPTAGQVNALTQTPPTINGYQYIDPFTGLSGYQIAFEPDTAAGNVGNPRSRSMTIGAGPFQGFKAMITPYTVTVTAKAQGQGAAEVRLRRELQAVAIPVFQFGVFDDRDLTFFAGDNFSFGGLVHTNRNLYLAQAGGFTLTFNDRITAREVIRQQLSNGVGTSAGIWTGNVRVGNGTGTPNPPRHLAWNEGSITGPIGTPPPAPLAAPWTPPAPWTPREPGWTTTSRTTYKGYIRSRTTGWNQLTLPIVDTTVGTQPIDLIKRPGVNSNEDVAQPIIFGQRYFSQASVRILLADTVAEILNLPTVSPDLPVPLDYLGPAVGDPYSAGFEHSKPLALRPWAPFAAASNGGAASGTIVPAGVYLTQNNNESVLGGFIKIEIQRADRTWRDVTNEILRLGVTGRNLADVTINTNNGVNNPADPIDRRNRAPGFGVVANQCQEPYSTSIVRLQRVRDLPISVAHRPCGTTNGLNSIPAALPLGMSVSPDAQDYWPLALYDPREGNIRDTGNGQLSLALNGIMHYVELDVNNLRQWLAGTIAGQGVNAWNNNGYILYFSDRRGNRTWPVSGRKEGEYGWEDNINPATAAGAPNGALDVGENHNENNSFEVYGAQTSIIADYNPPAGSPLQPAAGTSPVPFDRINPTAANANARHVAVLRARVNPPAFFRRALKLVNGGINGGVNSLPADGLTVASENPVYVQGNYNAVQNMVVADPSVPAAIVADSVTLLSTNWNDIRSFMSPNDPSPNGALGFPFLPGRTAVSTSYRFAVAAGKGLSFPRNNWANDTAQIWGTDGGVGNFLRLVEDWNPGAITIRYMGSIVSLYSSRQATGAFKCCNTVYQWGNRVYQFDTNFLIPANLPPGTPMFRDVNTLSFRQQLRPTDQ